MSFLRKRSTAVLIAAFVIIFGTLLGVYLSLNRETAKIEAQFYNGVFLRKKSMSRRASNRSLTSGRTPRWGFVGRK